MKHQTLAGAVLCLGMTTGVALTTAADNLVPDPGFAQADFTPLAEKTTWRQYQIAAPSEAAVDKAKNAVSLKGGKTFLHSSAFDVTAEKVYRAGLKAQGTGKVSIEFLWWTKYDNDGIGMASPHRTIPVKPTDVKDQVQEITGTDTAPKDAKRAYIRIVVEEGTIAVSEPSVALAP